MSSLTRLARVLGLGVLEAVSMGLAGWAFAAHRWLPDFVRRNSLSQVERRLVYLNVAVALGVGLVALAAVFAWKRRDGLDVTDRLVRRLSPLALAAVVPLLFDVRLWEREELLFLPLAAVFGFGARAATRAVLETEPAFPRLAAVRDRLLDRARSRFERAGRTLAALDAPLVVTVLAACAYAVYFSLVTIDNHRNLGTSSFDLGLEDNLMWNLSHHVAPAFRSTPFDGPTGTHLRNHATLFSYLLVPIYRLAPRAETLLVVQAAMMGAAAVPLHLFARRHVSPVLATLVALLYLAYPPLHGANLYDYHYLPLGVVFLWLTLYGVDARRPVLAAVAALLTASVREDVACCLGVLGVFLLLTGRSPRAGAALAAAGGGYFLVMKFGVMPLFGEGLRQSFISQYQGLLPEGTSGFGDVLGTVVTNPVFAENVVLDRDKLVYVLQLLVPVLFVPLWRPAGWLLLLPGFVFTLLSTGYAPLYQISFQYTSYWTAFVFVGVVLALEDTRSRQATDARPTRQRALAVGLVAATAACTYVYGAILQRGTARAGFDRVHLPTTDLDLKHRADLAALLAELPADARVAASEKLVPHVSNRESAYTLRFGVYDADYLLIRVPVPGDEAEHVVPALQDGTFGVVDARDSAALAKRGAPTGQNAFVLMH